MVYMRNSDGVTPTGAPTMLPLLQDSPRCNLSTKFAVSNSTNYEVTKGNTKYRKWGGLGVVRVTHGHRK